MNPWTAAIAGGALIGVASGGLMLASGRIAGVSGIAAGLLAPVRGDTAWRAAFVAGLVVAGALFVPAATPTTGLTPLWLIGTAGLLVGLGTRLAHGCTSGHGVCGLARLSLRSLAAVSTFLATGMIVVYVMRHVLRGVG